MVTISSKFSPMYQKAQVILLTMVAAIAYGVLHDEVTAHLCIEYFTAGHPRIFNTQSPALLGFCWGVVATFPLGAVIGAIFADVSQAGGAAPHPIGALARSLLLLLSFMALCALLAGILGFELARHSILSLPASFDSLVAPSRRARFMAVWFAHAASYLAGFAGSAWLAARIWRRRGKPPVFALFPTTPAGIIRALLLLLIIGLILFIRYRIPATPATP